MGEQENRQVVERLWQDVTQGNLDVMDEVLHEEYVQEWPQSGERIVGKENSKAINENYPGAPSMTPKRVVAGGDLVVSEVTLDYGQGPVHAVSIFELRDGKIVKETDYFADPFEAPEWRAQWVQRM